MKVGNTSGGSHPHTTLPSVELSSDGLSSTREETDAGRRTGGGGDRDYLLSFVRRRSLPLVDHRYCHIEYSSYAFSFYHHPSSDSPSPSLNLPTKRVDVSVSSRFHRRQPPPSPIPLLVIASQLLTQNGPNNPHVPRTYA